MLTGLASLAFFVGGLWRLPNAVNDRHKRPLCAALLAFGVGAIFDTEPAYGAFDRLVGMHNLADLFTHVLGLTGVYCLLRSLDGVAGAKTSISSRWLTTSLVVALSVSAILFLATPMPTETSAFTSTYADWPTIMAYWAISIVFPVLCLIQLGRTVAVHWGSPQSAMRRGLKITGVGVVLGFGYATLKLVEIICAGLGVDGFAAASRSLDRGLLGAGLLLIGVGLALPSLAAWVRPRRERRQVRQLLRRLDWLWIQFCHKAGAADVIDAGTPEFLLLRRVVELRDAQATLWSYLAAHDVDQVRRELRQAKGVEPSGQEVEAGALALALKRELCRMERGRGHDAPVASRVIVEPAPGGINLLAEVDELATLGVLVRQAVGS